MAADDVAGTEETHDGEQPQKEFNVEQTQTTGPPQQQVAVQSAPVVRPPASDSEPDRKAFLDVLSRIAVAVEELCSMLKSGQVAVPGAAAAPRFDPVRDYNEALGPSGTAHFKKTYTPQKVRISRRSGDGALEDTAVSVVVTLDRGGNFLLVSDSGRHLLFPLPEFTPEDAHHMIDIQQCYEIELLAVASPDRLIDAILSAVECTQVEDGWVVTKKGKLVVLTKSG
jgi:hypothetical protein